MTLLVKTLAYDEGLASRLTREPVVIAAIGFDCKLWPSTAMLAGHHTKCEPAQLSAGLVSELASRAGVVLLNTVEPAQATLVAAQAREAHVPVMALSAALASQDVLITVEDGKTYLGERAIKQLGARFPAAVLRLATIVSAPQTSDEEPTVREVSRDGEYPDEAREANVEGVVTLRLNVDVQGRVTEVVVLKGLGFGLDEEAVRRIRRYRFNPGRRGGIAVPMVTTFNFRFALQD